MRSAHPAFDLFLSVTSTSGKPITYISERTPDRQALYGWIPGRFTRQICYQSIKSFDMAVAVLRAKRPGAIVIFEHKPQYSMLLYLSCVLKNVPVLFFVHGLQQSQNRSTAHRQGFRLLQWLVRHLPFWPIHLEIGDGVLPAKLRFHKSLVLPHPLPDIGIDARLPFDRRRIRIGIVGMLRPDKPLASLLGALQAFVVGRPEYTLQVGTPLWQLSEELRTTGVHICDTSSEAQYFDFLLSCDIVVTSFDRSSFYFRPSGIINDALAAGCYVIAPNFVVFEAQLNVPCKVGATYESIDQLPARIEEAVPDLERSAPNHAMWRKARGREALLRRFASLIDTARVGNSLP